MKELTEIKYWIFDLDNTLYSGQTKVFSEVDKKMSSFISKKFNIDLVEAKKIQKEYFYEYGTTLSGLMKKKNVDPNEFLEFVHDIDISWLPKDKLLREELIKIKEKKYIFSNGSHDHINNVTNQLGIDDLFEGIFDISDAEYTPKPEPKAFDLMVKKFGINPKETIYVEDIAKNLSIGKERGCSTVWLKNNEQWGKMESDKDYIDHKIENLSLFLKEIRLLKSN